jgi:hypothetical protein
MDENLKYFLENTVVTKAAIESRLTHPIIKLRYPTRLVYVLLKKYANDFLKSAFVNCSELFSFFDVVPHALKIKIVINNFT